MKRYVLRILCRDARLCPALTAAAEADGGFLLASDEDAACDALLLDNASLTAVPVEGLIALRRSGVRVFLMLERYDALVAGHLRDAADHLFCLPQLPSAMLRRIRLYVSDAAGNEPPPTFDDAWIALQTDACLRAIGMPPHLLGYRYMREAARFLVRCWTPMHLSMMRDVYPAVARVEETSPVMVDRAMKHAVEVAWRRGNVLMQQVYFGYSSVDKKGMPTNAEWLYAIADRVRILLCDTRGKDRFTQMLRLLDDASDCGLSVDVTDAAW